MLPEKSFDTGEIVINYVEGPRSGPPMVLLHGLTARYQAWASISAHLTPEWHVFACDLRGHGNSGRANGEYRVVDYARDIACFLHRSVEEPAVVVGHSLGGLTAIEVASEVPECVSGVVLLDPPLFVGRHEPCATMPSAFGWFQFVHATLKASSAYDGILARLQAASPPMDERALQDQADCVCHLDIGTVAAAIQDRMGDGWNLEHALASIKAPALLLYGDWDHGAAVRAEDAAYFKAHVREAAMVKVPNGSHLFPWEQMDLTLEDMDQFLQSGITGR
jgi:pimeloyl-ACP methyl ester carboxylesterase